MGLPAEKGKNTCGWRIRRWRDRRKKWGTKKTRVKKLLPRRTHWKKIIYFPLKSWGRRGRTWDKILQARPQQRNLSSAAEVCRMLWRAGQHAVTVPMALALLGSHLMQTALQEFARYSSIPHIRHLCIILAQAFYRCRVWFFSSPLSRISQPQY